MKASDILTISNLRVIALPLGLIIAVLVLGVFGGQFMYSKISELRVSVDSMNAQQADLRQKLQVLQAFETRVGVVDSVTSAIPAENPSLAALSQIRTKASEKGLILGEINVGRGSGANESALSFADISFGVSGDLAATLQFMQSLRRTAPLGIIDNFEVATGQGTESEVAYKVYWSALPTQLPSVTEPLAEFSQEENSVIETLSTLESPVAFEITPEQLPLFVPNSNPFGI